MWNYKWIRFLGVSTLFVLLTASCAVEEEPSLLLVGSIALDGQRDPDTNVLECSFPNNIMSPKLFFSRGQINLSLLRTVGQDRQPGDDGANSEFRGPVGAFHFMGGFQNRLPDSRSVGSGSAGANFPNMRLDTNWVQTSGAEVKLYRTFQANGGTQSFEMVRERTFSAILESGGGSVVMGIPIIENRDELDDIEAFLTDRLENRTDSFTFFAEIKILGKTFSGTEVESNVVKYPIEICVECTELGVTPTCLE